MGRVESSPVLAVGVVGLSCRDDNSVFAISLNSKSQLIQWRLKVYVNMYRSQRPVDKRL